MSNLSRYYLRWRGWVSLRISPMFGWTILRFRPRRSRTRITPNVMGGIMTIGSIWRSWMGWWRIWRRFVVKRPSSSRCLQSRHSQLELEILEWLDRSLWILGFLCLEPVVDHPPFFLEWDWFLGLFLTSWTRVRVGFFVWHASNVYIFLRS